MEVRLLKAGLLEIGLLPHAAADGKLVQSKLQNRCRQTGPVQTNNVHNKRNTPGPAKGYLGKARSTLARACACARACGQA
jgi:hypothetical protein